MVNRFQSTLPHGERQFISIRSEYIGSFQSTLPHGERLSFLAGHRAPCLFQSTLPHGERPDRPNVCTQAMNFNPRSRMGSDMVISSIIFTSQNFNPRSRMGSDPDNYEIGLADFDISIHAPAWGATRVPFLLSLQATHFNPRSRMGSDYTEDEIKAILAYFNPRSRMGSDIISLTNFFAPHPFQSTLPHGERR